MRRTIWLWFMEFVFVTFLLLWVCQGLFLQNFYDRMKTKDIMRLSDKMIELYQEGDYQDEFKQLAMQNELCIEVRDRFNRSVDHFHYVGGSCFLHGYNNHVTEIVQRVRSSQTGFEYWKDTHPVPHVDLLIYARVIGSNSMPEGYLLIADTLEEMAEKISALPQSDREFRAFIRDFFGNSEICYPDAQGRIIIPAKLREYANIKKDLVTLGAMNKIEIWSAEIAEETAGENLMDNQSLTDKLKDFGL